MKLFLKLTLFSSVCLFFLLVASKQSSAQYTTNVPIYANAVVGGFQDWSWSTHNDAETTTVYPGCTDAIEVDYTPYGGLWFKIYGSSIPGNQFSSLSFYINGGSTGGQQFTIQAQTASATNTPVVSIANYVPGGTVPTNKWTLVTIPLADLGVATAPDINGILFYNPTGNSLPALYLDQIVLNGPTPPSNVLITVYPAQTLHTVDQREFGVNTAMWDGIINSPSTESLLQSAGTGVIRIPGGSASDGYDWTSQSYSGQTMTPQFANLAAALGAQTYVTVNYGSGTPQEAAAWVAYCNSAVGASDVNFGLDSNGRDWITAQYWAALRAASPLATDDGMNFLRVQHTAPFGFHNWEIGNEIFGSWEYDKHAKPNDPVTYGNLYVQFKNAMKAVDPTIAVGAVITADEDSFPASGESVTNPVTGVSHSGWTAILFSTLASLGVAPDSVSLHNYGNGGSPYSDPIVLHYPQQWTTTAAGIRTMLTDYLGASKSASVQLANTESNTTGYNTGKQMTSIVDGLYYADFEGALMQTEFVGNIWWDLHNGADTSGNLDPSLYGWRLYADYGVLSVGSGNPGDLVANTPYPAYYAMKLISKFARSGDTVVAASSSYINLTAYAVHQAGGTLALLVVNKDPNLTIPTTIILNSFYSAPTATLYQYGLAQDTAQSLGQSVDIADTAVAAGGATVQQSFPPYSMSVLQLSPGIPALATSPTSVSLGQNASGPLSIGLTKVTGFSGSETLSATGLPTGVTASFGPSSISGVNTSTITFTADATAPVGSANVTITGNCGALTTSIAIPVTVIAGVVKGIKISVPSINAGQTAIATVTLASPVTASTVVTLTSSNPAVSSVSATITIPANATTATVNIVTLAVSTNTGVTITAAANGGSAHAPLQIIALPFVTALSISPNSTYGGSATTGTVTINEAALAGGKEVALSTSNAELLGFPSPIYVPVGATTTTFPIRTASIAAAATATITAVAGGGTQTSSVTVNAVPFSMKIAPAQINAGQVAIGTITLAQTATTSTVVSISSSHSSVAAAMTSITIPAGSTSGSFNISTTAITSNTNVTLTAMADGDSVSAPLSLLALPFVTALSVSPNPVVGGSKTTGTVTINEAAPAGGKEVALITNSTGVVSLMSPITVPAGATSTTFMVGTSAVTTITSVNVTAVAGGGTQTVNLTIEP